jgi:hypothetical protein
MLQDLYGEAINTFDLAILVHDKQTRPAIHNQRHSVVITRLVQTSTCKISACITRSQRETGIVFGTCLERPATVVGRMTNEQLLVERKRIDRVSVFVAKAAVRSPDLKPLIIGHHRTDPFDEERQGVETER